MPNWNRVRRGACAAALAVIVLAAWPVVNVRADEPEPLGQSKDSPILIGGPVKEPRRTKTVVPDYPENAKQGMVYLTLLVTPEGRVESAQARYDLEGATEAAIAAARQWEYEPVLHDGQPAWFQIIVGLPNPWPSPE